MRPKSQREKILAGILQELKRRQFSVELYEDFSGDGIRGNLDIYPLVFVNVYIHRNTSEILACIFFERDNHRDMVIAANPELNRKMNQKRYFFSVNVAEIARQIIIDGLLLGATLDAITKRQELSARLDKV